MKIVISDFPKVLKRNVEYEEQLLQKLLPDAKICLVEYWQKEQWLKTVKDADAILTAFIRIDGEMMDAMPDLKCIVLNASGYDNVDLTAASARHIAVVPIREYCTQEVAEHALSLMLALSRGLKHYEHDIDAEKKWQYTSLKGLRRIDGQTLGIAGFGKIGKAVAKRAQAFGMHVIAYSPYSRPEEAEQFDVEFVSKEELFARSHIITNHMAMSADNQSFFDWEAFSQMKQKPIFINVARGGAVDEEALVRALDEGLLLGAGLDVLSSESPNLKNCPLTGRENVIITPHAAFYSEDSLRALQDISCNNLVHYLKGEYDAVHWIANQDALGI